MQQKVKAIGYGCMLALAVMLLVQAWSLLGEREALATQEQGLRQELAQAKQFALAHKDYEVYKKRLEAQVSKLERAGSRRSSVTACMRLVHRLAAEQGVQLQLVQGEVKQSLQLTAEGDFFAALRWLRRLEREGVCISELQVYQKAQGQTLGLELVVRI